MYTLTGVMVIRVRLRLVRSEPEGARPQADAGPTMDGADFTVEELAWFRGPYRERDGNG